MNEDFEQRLRARFAANDEPPVSEQFGGAVRKRIAALRRARQLALAALAAAAGLAIVLVGAPLLSTGTIIADAPVTLNAALSGLLVSPAGFVLGALSAAAALAAASTD